MPFYEIFHVYPLTPTQRRELAEQITTLHCTTFSVPSAFVNVVLYYCSNKEGSKSDDRAMFVGGKEAQTNYITAHLRPRGIENRPKLLEIIKSLTHIWDSMLQPSHPGRLDDERALHGVVVMEDIAAGAEQGFLVPVAGEDGGWAAEHLAEFRKRADAGDESMQGLVMEVEQGFGKADRTSL